MEASIVVDAVRAFFSHEFESRDEQSPLHAFRSGAPAHYK
jgi:hypothetical protein